MSERGAPYAMRFIVAGERGPDGVPYTAVEAGVDAYGIAPFRDAIEEQGRTAFAHMHPGAVIASTSWGPLYGGELDPDDDGADACGHGDNPDENCEGCYG